MLETNIDRRYRQAYHIAHKERAAAFTRTLRWMLWRSS